MRNHIVDALFFYFIATDGRKSSTGAGIQQFHVIVNLRNGAHCGARIRRNHFLFNGNGWRYSFYIVHIRFIQFTQKLSGIRAQTFYITALTLRIQSIESQRRLARARKSCNHRKFPMLDFDINILQVVNPSAVYMNNLIGHN